MLHNKYFVLLFILLMSIVLLKPVIAYSPSELNSETSVSFFLNNVAGIDTTEYSIIIFESSRSLMPNSNSYQVLTKVILNRGSLNMSALFTSIDGKFWTYNLRVTSGELTDAEVTYNDRLNLAKQALDACGACFDAPYYHRFADILSQAINEHKTVIDSNSLVQKISEGESSIERTKIQSFEKINDQYTVPARSLSLSVSSQGYISRIVDNLAIFHVAESEITVSREEAISISMPMIEKYAHAHGQEVVNTDAKLTFVTDIGSLRGDRFAVYPEWTVSALFDRFNDDYVSSYGVVLWADNGNMVDHGPKKLPVMLDEKGQINMSTILAPILIVFLLACILTVLHTYYRRHSKKVRNIK